MFKKYFLIFLLFLTGCASSVLPNKEKNLSDFIPEEEKTVEQKTYSIEDFKEAHFPDDCQWRTLDRVVDGDTIEVEDGLRVRFIGIDTPETKDEDKPIQRFGMEAYHKTKELLQESDRVCLILDEEGDTYDVYQRLLAYVFTEKEVDVNAELLKGGFARGYLYFPFSRKEEFSVYHEEAKVAKRGLWGKN
ncbi:thermonuclease family protein [Candidatus Gracilibacteria bacterium]|nr:thermonuclease family protein [Candidatus Gracilibacteria bacterium]